MAQIIEEAVYCDNTGRLIEPASVRCRCGAAHELGFNSDSTCECGQSYNAFGQEIIGTGFNDEDFEPGGRYMRDDDGPQDDLPFPEDEGRDEYLNY